MAHPGGVAWWLDELARALQVWSVAQCRRHLGHADAPAVGSVAGEERRLLPSRLTRAMQVNRAAEHKGHRQAERPVAAVDLQSGRVTLPDVETGDQGGEGAAYELHYRRHMRGHFPGNPLTCP